MSGRTKGYERYRTLFWRFFKGAVVPEWTILLPLAGAFLGISFWGRPGGYLALAALVLFWVPVQRRTRERFLKVAPKKFVDGLVWYENLDGCQKMCLLEDASPEFMDDLIQYKDRERVQRKWCRRRLIGSIVGAGEIGFLTRQIEFTFQGDVLVWKSLAVLAVTACIWVWGAAFQAHALAVELYWKGRNDWEYHNYMGY